MTLPEAEQHLSLALEAAVARFGTDWPGEEDFDDLQRRAVAAVEPGGAEPDGVQPDGVQSGGVEPGGIEPGGIEPGAAGSPR